MTKVLTSLIAFVLLLNGCITQHYHSKDSPMAMSPDITIDAVTYSSSIVKPNSTVRADATQPVTDPDYMTVSHETAQNGRVSSVIIFEDIKAIPCNDTCQIVPGQSSIKAMLKIQYNPKDGREDFNAALVNLLAAINTASGDAALMDKFLNKEH